MDSSQCDKLKEILLHALPLAAPASGGTHVVTRCRFCGDSNDPKSKHFYIKIGYDGRPPVYYCQKCKIWGFLTYSFLNDYGIYDIDIAKMLTIKEYKGRGQSLNKNKNIFLVSNNFIRDENVSHIKLQYINNRLGQKLSFDDLLSMKIVLNLLDYISNNGLYYNRHVNAMNILDQWFIGFLSCDNSYMTLKNLGKGKLPKYIDHKYEEYDIMGFDEKTKLYIIPSIINTSSRQRIRVNFAEGPFDILGVYLNVLNKQNAIYCAVCGKDYLIGIRHVLTDLRLFYSEFHIYRDSDDDMNSFYQLREILRPFNIPLYIHTNLKGKDYGVKSDDIEDSFVRLL